MNQLFNESEQLVYDICKKSFLSLWSYANPLGKNLKELCDVLIVCDPDIIIISVKDISITDSGDISTDWKRLRWQHDVHLFPNDQRTHGPLRPAAYQQGGGVNPGMVLEHGFRCKILLAGCRYGHILWS